MTLFTKIEDVISGEFEIRAECLRAYRRGFPLDLRPRELRLLHLFLQNRGKILTRAEIRDALQAAELEEERSVDVYVMRLRKAIICGRMRDPIETVKLRGYRFRPLSASERGPQAPARLVAEAQASGGE